jgi:hypothetical protein
MKPILATILTLTVLNVAPAMAAESEARQAQNNRMSECSAQAKKQGLQGDARKEHMSQCLRNPASQAAAKECRATAGEKGLKGDRRKEFVNECIKGKTPSVG